MYKWLLFGHLIGVAFLVAGFAIYVANLDRLPLAKTVADIRTHLAVAAVGEQVLILGGALLIPSALIMARQYWSLFRGWIATSIALVLAQGAAGAAISFHVRKLRAHFDHQVAPGDEIPPQIAALARNRLVQAIDRAAIANLVEIVFLMTVKPTGGDLVLSLVATVLAAVLLGATAYRPSREALERLS
jgi:uncharacterized membrane protein